MKWYKASVVYLGEIIEVSQRALSIDEALEEVEKEYGAHNVSRIRFHIIEEN